MKTESFIYGLDCNTKQEAVGIMIRELGIKDFDMAFEAVMKREALGNTCIGHSIAIPHGKTDAVEKLSYVCARTLKPVDWGDGATARIIILTLSPVASCGPHVLFLSHVAKLLEDPEIRERIENASSVEDMKEAFGIL